MDNKLKKYSIVSILLLWSFTLFAQVDFRLEVPKYAKQGQRIRATFVLNEKPDEDIQLPQIKGLRLLMGPSVSHSTSIEIRNGKVKNNSTHLYSYIFLAEQKGKFTIPAVSATIDGKTYETKPKTIEVLENDIPVANQTHRQQTQRQAQQPTRRTTLAKNEKENFFVRVLLSKNKAYPNEHIVATLKLYTRYHSIAEPSINPPSFKGFLSKEIPNSSQNQFVQENINGKIYNTVVIGKYMLFPQRAGKLTIDDFSVDAVAGVRTRGRDIFDEFFGNAGMQQFRVSAKNPATSITVLPFPTNAPNSFTNAVGKFNLQSTLNTDSVAVNEAVTLKIKLTGNGNLQMQKAPKLALSPDLEVYDPKTANHSKITSGGMQGNISFEYLIIPRQAGVFEIPAVPFTYFNTQTHRYQTLHTQAYTLKVANGKGQTALSGQAISHYQKNKQEVAVLGDDINYIKVKQPVFRQKDAYFWNSLPFWVLLLAFPLLAICYYIFVQNRQKNATNTLKNKSKRANKVAIKRLKTAKKSLENAEKEAFYTHTLDALWGFVSDKLHLPTSKLNKDNVEQLLHEKGVSTELIADYMATLNDCEMAQYAPLASADMQSSYENAITIISKLEEKL